MKQHSIVLLAAFAAATLAGCNAHGAQSQVGIVDTQRLLQYWPKFQNYNNQFSVDMATIDRSRAPENQKARERYQLQAKYSQVQQDLTNEVRTAATQVAHDQHYQLVVTREFVGYGGTDITPDVEKLMKITEASPSASP